MRDFAALHGWLEEYKVIEHFIQELQEGKKVEINKAIEEAKKTAWKDNGNALLIATDEDCYLHAPLAKYSKDARSKQLLEQPENEERLRCLVGTPPLGILNTDDYLESDVWLNSCQPAAISDILRVHEYSYIHYLTRTIESIAKKSTLESDPENDSTHHCFIYI